MKLSYNDKTHAYWLDGKRCTGVSTIAKIPDNTYGLDKWRQRQVAIGMACSPPLVERAAAHFDDRDQLDTIVEEAHVAAKAHEASGRGTAIHRVTERIDHGLDWIKTPLSEHIARQWEQALDAANLEIVPELIERAVVYPEQLVAGRFDRVARYRTTQQLVGVDIKSGENAIKYPHSTAIQLGLYFNAPLIAAPTVGESWTVEQFEPLPDELATDHALVIYLPAEGDAAVHRIDIAAGWETARTVCFPVLAWRRRDDLTRLVNIPNLTPATSPERHTWLCRRIRVIVDAGHEPALAGLWDTSKVPAPLTPNTVLTDPQVDLVVEWCAQVEAAVEAPFPDIDPLFAAFAQATQATEAPRVPPAENPVDGARGELARHWADQGRQLLEAYELDQPMVAAVLAAAHMTGTETMDADLYTRLAALVSQATDTEGAVMFLYDQNGPTVVPAPDAEARMTAAAGTRGEARDRAARLAKRMGRIAPRSLPKAAENPLLAALVAAGHGADTPTTNSQENT